MTRECGGCTACCSTLRIPTLNKPEYLRCPNQCEKGCAVYETRPTECAEYSCHWLAEINVLLPIQQGHAALGEPKDVPLPFPKTKLFPLLREEERPDKCGVLLEWSAMRPEGGFTKATGIQFFHAREVVPGAFASWHGKKLLDRVAKKHLILLVWEGTKRAARGPPLLVRMFAKYAASAGLR
jgi:hypothetical protein